MDKTDRRLATVCVGVVLAALACTWPVAESGVIDDWCYAKAALDLAQTGHLQYRGWGGSMIGAQAYWGALFIKLFGFSFLVLRLSTLPLALGSVVLLYLLCRQAALPPGLALFGTLALALTPIFLICAVTFMTDIPALFLLLLSMYGYTRLAQELEQDGSPWRLRLWGWTTLGLAAGILGGTVRQVVWFVPITASAYLFARAWRERRLARSFVPVVVSGLIALDVAMELQAWYNMQPFAMRLSIEWRSYFMPGVLTGACSLLAIVLQTVGLMLLPVLTALPLLYYFRLRDLRLRWLCFAGALFCAALLWIGGLWCYREADYGGTVFFDFLNGVASVFPLLFGSTPVPVGVTQPTMPVPAWWTVQGIVSVFVCFALSLGISAPLWPNGRTRYNAPAVVRMLIAFSAAYISIIFIHCFGSHAEEMMDRYLLELAIPLIMVILGVYWRWTGSSRLPGLSWLVLALICFYGVAQAHDYFALLRARVAMTDRLQQQGIPRTQIMAGTEHDCWTQLSTAGYINDPRIRYPEGLKFRRVAPLGFETLYLGWQLTPVVRPHFVVALAPHPGLKAAGIPPACYTCWLPPFRRSLMAQLGPEALSSKN